MLTQPCPAYRLATAQIRAYRRDGYLILRRFWAAPAVAGLRQELETLAAGDAIAGHWDPAPPARNGIRRHPDVRNPHQVLPACRDMLLDRRLHGVLRKLAGGDLLAAHSLYSFKPPSAGPPPDPDCIEEPLTLQVTPGPCVVAWTAVDAALPENGGLQVIPGSHDRDPQPCPPDEVPMGDLLPLADEMPTVPLPLQPGDVLVFDGTLRHGCSLNRTRKMWRRSLICHYVPASAEQVVPWFTTALDFAGGERALAPQTTSPDAFRAFLEAL